GWQGLECHHHADNKASNTYQHDRLITQVIALPQRFFKFIWWLKNLNKKFRRKSSHATGNLKIFMNTIRNIIYKTLFFLFLITIKLVLPHYKYFVFMKF